MTIKDTLSITPPKKVQSKLTKIHKNYLKEVKLDFDNNFVPPKSFNFPKTKLKIESLTLTNKGVIVLFNDSQRSLVKVKEYN